ncbi:MAG: lytic transglycosylase domain-containing protein [Bacilli bacterium]
MLLRKFFSMPRKPEDLFPWLLRWLVSTLGIGYVLGALAVLVASVSLFAFLIGDFQGGGSGTVNPGGVTLSVKTKAKEQRLLAHEQTVANAWESGLSPSQIAQVVSSQMDLPGVVLLAIGKLENNLSPPDARLYAPYLMPTFTWQTFTLTTKTYERKRTKSKTKGNHHKNQCTVSMHTQSVTKLMSANTWDGTLHITYQFVTTGQSGCPSSGQRVVSQTLRETSVQRVYTWQRVWALLRAIPARMGLKKHAVIKDTATNRQFLAGLIATQDSALGDPTVQQMVDQLLFGGSTPLTLGSPSGLASGSVVQTVLRWKSDILMVAKRYHIPPALVAGVMAQESGGHEHASGGSVLTSSAGALGLMQVEPTTAVGMYVSGRYIGANAIADLSSGPLNLQIGAKYLAELYHLFGDNRVDAESAYNAGPGAEEQALAQGVTVVQDAQTIAYVAAIEGEWMPALSPSI